MRLNKFLAEHTHLSRRKADDAVRQERVMINGTIAGVGATVDTSDDVTLDGRAITPTVKRSILIMLNKPEGFVCSRRGQGSSTIYELLPKEYHSFNPVGRLDKDSSGLLLLTNDGELLNELSHPSRAHTKHYLVGLKKPLSVDDEVALIEGVDIGDTRLSKLGLKLLDTNRRMWEVTLNEGRNRQIRRTFAAVGNHVISLHRTSFGHHTISNLPSGKLKKIMVK